jgi:molybdenum cofactor cytidylyltransferase
MEMNCAAVILAAGAASRFGSPKQLLEINGETLLDRACRVAREADCGAVLRVLGGHAKEILFRPCPPGILTLHHEAWRDGMGSSLAAGLRELLAAHPDLDGIFILLPDQPQVTPDLLRKMPAAGSAIVLCEHAGLRGPPAFFRRAHFSELLALSGDRGAKAVAARHPDQLATVDFPGLAQDIDTPEAWEKFLAE